tara:strand:- start:11719 stop:11952 length:234 start_codon:yes stop_codon:yes gene_type:complete
MPQAFYYNSNMMRKIIKGETMTVGKEYNNLSETEQAHLDAKADYYATLEEEANKKEGECVCGEVNCPDEYAHHTSGW